MINDINERLAVLKNLNTNYLIEANAGSGKTSMLVARMVALVESGVPIEQIVTITFTKKAANEFYERFYALLNARSKKIYTKIKDDCLPMPPTSQAKDRNLEALKKIDFCFMGTIDAFCNSILLEHPLEAKVSSCAQIIEEKYLIPHINDFIYQASKGKYGVDIQKSIRFISTLFSHNNIIAMSLHALDNRAYDFVHDAPSSDNYQNELRNFTNMLVLLKKALSFIANLSDSLFDNSPKHLITYRYIKNEIDNINSYAATDLIHLKRLIDKVNGFIISLKTKLDYNLIIKAGLSSLLIKNSRSIVLKLDSFKKPINYFRYCHALEFMTVIKKCLASYLNEKGLLNFTDNLLYVHAMLSDEKNGPSLLAKIQKKHKYYLIDEFQDTSPIQAELFFRLAATNYIANINDVKLQPGALFMVGDPKQSIYHFRGADIASYLNIKNLIINKHLGEVLVLTENFRSNKTLCDYFDLTFKKDFFTNNITYKTINSSKNVTDDIHDIMTYTTSEKDDANNVANLVKQLINDKSKKIKGRCLTYNDFMIILLRKEDIPSYRFALLNLGIPSFVEGKINFIDSRLVTSLIAIFNYLTHRDNFTAYQVLVSPLFNDINLNNVLKDYNSDAISLLKEIFIDLPTINENIIPSTVFKILLENKTIYSSVGFFGLDNAIALLNLMIEEENKGNITSLDSACRFLSCCLDSDIERIAPLNYQNNVVHIANLHKLKGLQANVVVLAFSKKKDTKNIDKHIDETNKKEYLFSLKDYVGGFGKIFDYVDACNQAFVDDEKQYAEEEYKRLLYVAATRPANALYVSTSSANSEDSFNSYWEPLIKNINDKMIISINSPSNNLSKTTIDNLIDKELLIQNQREIHYESSYQNILPSKIVVSSKYQIEEETPHIKGTCNATIVGSMVHSLMENIMKANPRKLDIAICRSIANEYEFPECKALLESVYQTIYNGGYKQENGAPDDIYHYARNYECATEVPFAYYENNNLITGSIDLLLKKENEVIVIDYKTDKNIKTNHEGQLNAYKDAVKKSTGKNAKAYIYNIKIN